MCGRVDRIVKQQGSAKYKQTANRKLKFMFFDRVFLEKKEYSNST
jgi:hypothetical protein